MTTYFQIHLFVGKIVTLMNEHVVSYLQFTFWTSKIERLVNDIQPVVVVVIVIVVVVVVIIIVVVIVVVAKHTFDQPPVIVVVVVIVVIIIIIIVVVVVVVAEDALEIRLAVFPR